MRLLASFVVAILASPLAVANDQCSGPNARTTPVKGDLVVDVTGKYAGSYLNISEAIKHVPPARPT